MDCWVVSDGRAGIENQALGLAEATARRIDLTITVKRIKVEAPWRSLPAAFWGDPLAHLSATAALLRPPFPRLVVACGRLAAPVAAALKAKAPETFVVQVQPPRGRIDDYDLVVPPLHDRIVGDNVVSILGAPNRLTPNRLAEDANVLAQQPEIAALPAPRVAVLLGGRNRAYAFDVGDGERLGRDLAALARCGAGLMITASRRTPPPALGKVRAALAGTPHFLWNGAPLGALDNPYFGMLGLAEAVLVTVDSVNMAAEAGAAGKPVHFLSLRRRPFSRDAKFSRFRQALIDRGVARPYTGRLEAWSYEPLAETDRAAAELVARLSTGAASPA